LLVKAAKILGREAATFAMNRNAYSVRRVIVASGIIGAPDMNLLALGG
jgi:hypothetical protein